MATRPTLNVSLTPGLARFVRDRVRAGRNRNADEVVREALHLLEARDRGPVTSVEALKQEIEVGLAQLRRGMGVDGESFFRDLRIGTRPKSSRRSGEARFKP